MYVVPCTDSYRRSIDVIIVLYNIIYFKKLITSFFHFLKIAGKFVQSRVSKLSTESIVLSF